MAKSRVFLVLLTVFSFVLFSGCGGDDHKAIRPVADKQSDFRLLIYEWRNPDNTTWKSNLPSFVNNLWYVQAGTQVEFESLNDRDGQTGTKFISNIQVYRFIANNWEYYIPFHVGKAPDGGEFWRFDEQREDATYIVYATICEDGVWTTICTGYFKVLCPNLIPQAMARMRRSPPLTLPTVGLPEAAKPTGD